MSTDSIQSTETQIQQRVSALLADALSDGGYLAEGVSHDAIATAVNRTLTQADSEWKSYLQSQIRSSAAQVAAPKARKKKSSNTRKRTSYNMYVKSKSASIREELKLAAGQEPLERGATMKEVGVRWNALDADGRAPFVVLAAEFNATLEIATAQVAACVTPVAPPTDYAELVGPYPNTYARGVIGGTQSFKTLDDAVVAMRNNPNAAAIVQAKNDGRFKLRAGFLGKGNHPNVDANGATTPGFVYNANTAEQTWARKSALDSYAEHGPYTKINPFCEPDAGAHASATLSPVDSSATAVAASPLADVAETHTDAVDDYQSDDSDGESEDEDEVKIHQISMNGIPYWCFPTGHLLDFHEDCAPRDDCYTGNKIVGDIVAGGVYGTDDVVDGGTLPAEYVTALNQD
jgi:hypothetical protein